MNKIKFTFAMNDWFSQDLVDAVGVFLDLEESHSDLFEWQLKRWAYISYSYGKYYRKTLLIEKYGEAPRVVEWWAKEQLESLILDELYNDEDEQ